VLEFICAAGDMVEQFSGRAGRRSASAEPDRPKVSAQIHIRDHDFLEAPGLQVVCYGEPTHRGRPGAREDGSAHSARGW